LESGSTVDARQRFGLVWALILSILLHAVLLILSVWFPFSRSAAVVAVDSEEETITFSFAEPVEPTTDDPLEDARFTPFEPQPSDVPAPLPIPEGPEVPPLEQVEPETPEAPIEEEATPREAPQETEAEETTEQVEPPGSELRERPDALVREAPADDQASPRARQIDMQEALRDFGRAMARRPPQPEESRPAPGTKQNVIVPDLSRIPFSGFGVGNLVFESRDYDWSDYGRQIYMAIWRAWHNRLWLTTEDFSKWAHRSGSWRLKHMAQVRFVIENNGQVTGIVVEAGSDCEPLDASAVDALAEVILPPLPAGFPRDREIVHARFIAQGPIRGMRDSLGAMKAAGYF
jgi:outer membrane biosynthesis protein TonB